MVNQRSFFSYTILTYRRLDRCREYRELQLQLARESTELTAQQQKRLEVNISI